jgi:hypothetical protein
VEHRRVLDALQTTGIGVDACVLEVGRVTEDLRSQHRLRAMREVVSQAAGLENEIFERSVLLLTAARSLDRLDEMPLPPQVKRYVIGAFDWLGGKTFTLAGGSNRFVEFAKIASLRRWPAGLLDWELSGLPRSWIPRIRPASQLVRTISLVAIRWKGFGPAFFSHLTICRPVRALLPRDAERSYSLMARALQLQPHVKGFITSSWFHSPDTFRVSPHLAGLNDVFVENGGIVATMGRADPDCGVFSRSPERKRAFDEGHFRPTLGLVIWPREQLIEWAERHPELASP